MKKIVYSLVLLGLLSPVASYAAEHQNIVVNKAEKRKVEKIKNQAVANKANIEQGVLAELVITNNASKVEGVATNEVEQNPIAREIVAKDVLSAAVPSPYIQNVSSTPSDNKVSTGGTNVTTSTHNATDDVFSIVQRSFQLNYDLAAAKHYAILHGANVQGSGSFRSPWDINVSISSDGQKGGWAVTNEGTPSSYMRITYEISYNGAGVVKYSIPAPLSVYDKYMTPNPSVTTDPTIAGTLYLNSDRVNGVAGNSATSPSSTTNSVAVGKFNLGVVSQDYDKLKSKSLIINPDRMFEYLYYDYHQLQSSHPTLASVILVQSDVASEVIYADHYPEYFPQLTSKNHPTLAAMAYFDLNAISQIIYADQHPVTTWSDL